MLHHFVVVFDFESVFVFVFDFVFVLVFDIVLIFDFLLVCKNQIFVKNLRILAQLLHLSESHLLRLCFGVFQPSVFCVFSRTQKQTVKCQYNRTQSWWRI